MGLVWLMPSQVTHPSSFLTVLPASCLGRETLVGVLSELMRVKVVGGKLKARWALDSLVGVFWAGLILRSF